MTETTQGAGILVCHRNEHGHRRFLIQQRGEGARDQQGTWELSAAGSLLSGEDPLTGALREFQEEMGEPPPLVIVSRFTWTGMLPGSHSDRFTAFLAEAEEEFTPQPDPHVVSDWRWVSGDEVLQLPLHTSFAREIQYLMRSTSLWL